MISLRPKCCNALLGISLLEVLVVISLILILVGLLVPNFESLRVRAEGVVCTSRLRNLWGVFSSNLQDGRGWPQVPKGIRIGSIQEQQWWLDYSSNSMGITIRDWSCPTIKRSARTTNSSDKACLISYLPTLFDNKPNTPTKWPAMPWFTEIGNAHGNGNLLIRTDGAVVSGGGTQK